MSENKRYYWLKLKKDFFDSKMIKILRTFEKGNEMILTFLKIELHSLVTDGYVYFENMLPSFEQELAVAIDENIEIVKLTVETLLKFGAIKKIDENTYYLTIIEDCIGSESSSANRMRKLREKEVCDNNASQSDVLVSQCDTEKEIEKEKSKSRDREDKDTSALFSKKKSGSVNVQNANFPTESTAPEHNSAARANPPRNYEIEAFLKNNNLTYEDFMPDFARG